MIGRLIAFVTRLLTGGMARWRGCAPEAKQRIYFANHTSNLDFVLLWSALPTRLREKTRPIAAQDYWSSSFRSFLAQRVFRAVLIERKKVTRESNPLEPMLQALSEGSSLIIFPEGTRLSGEALGPFRPGLFHLAKARPDVEFVPVYIENLNRVLPKGEFLPVPMLCSVHFGTPLVISEDELKADFLERSRNAMLSLRPI